MASRLRHLPALAGAVALGIPALRAETPPASLATSTPLTLNDTGIYTASLTALTMLFVLAVLLENAFATIFNWRVFLAYFSSRGIKTVIMIVAAWIVVGKLGMDAVASLVAVYKFGPGGAQRAAEVSGPFTSFITALILAGGSAGVNNLMVALGFRDRVRTEDVAPRPPPTQAWVSITVDRRAAVGLVLVRVKDLGPTAGLADPPAPIAGSVGFHRTGLTEILLRNPKRFPPNGGYTILPNHVYEITVEGKDANGGAVVAQQGERFVLAPGAILDLKVTL